MATVELAWIPCPGNLAEEAEVLASLLRLTLMRLIPVTISSSAAAVLEMAAPLAGMAVEEVTATTLTLSLRNAAVVAHSLDSF